MLQKVGRKPPAVSCPAGVTQEGFLEKSDLGGVHRAEGAGWGPQGEEPGARSLLLWFRGTRDVNSGAF